MESGWMVFLWVGAAAGILLVWLVISAVVVLYFEDRHERRAADRSAPESDAEPSTERRIPTSVS